MTDFKMPERPQNSNKGDFGKVLNFSGSDKYIGAAYLSTLSILKSGAGLAALSSTAKATDSVSKMLPEAIYLSRKDGIKNADNYTVYLIGCGFGITKSSISDFNNIMRVIKNTDKPVIIDADGLNILSENSKIVLPYNTIITPHPAEAARLLSTTTDDVICYTEKAAKMLCEKFKSITVLKTHRTIICNGTEIFINMHGNTALSKAGTGDVLAGIIAGLAAQKMNLFEAAKLGVYLHSKAGELASEQLTEYCVLASDVINYLPEAIKSI